MLSYLNFILNSKKEIIDLKNTRSHISNLALRKNIACKISKLESLCEQIKKEVQPFVEQLSHPLKKMVEDSFMKGAPFSYGVQQHVLKNDKPEATKKIQQKAKKKLSSDELEKRVSRCIEDKYRKQLYRAIYYYYTHE